MNGVNAALNAVIAYLEDRPSLFKELLRSPGSDVKNLPELEARLQRAIKHYASTQIRVGLTRTLHVDANAGGGILSEDEQAIYYAGARAAEKIFEELSVELDNA